MSNVPAEVIEPDVVREGSVSAVVSDDEESTQLEAHEPVPDKEAENAEVVLKVGNGQVQGGDDQEVLHQISDRLDRILDEAVRRNDLSYIVDCRQFWGLLKLGFLHESPHICTRGKTPSENFG